MKREKPKSELVYSVPELSRLLRISTAHGYKVIREGWVPSLRLGKRIVIPKAALDKLLSCGDQRSP
jgi:excisionase family DNA binding protein